VSSLSQRSLIHLGMDVHKESISIGILRPDDSLDVERIFHDEESVRRFIARMGEPRQLTACYEAGPTGYGLHRLLQQLQVPCQVVAPSLIPKAPGDRVKTDRRDCRRLARLRRAGELTPIRVPTREEEAVRDLCRARGDMVIDLDRARRRLGAFLLAPWPGLAGGLEVDAQARGLAVGGALPRCRPGDDLRPLPLDRARVPAASEHHRGAHPGERGLRLAALRQSILVHGLRGTGGLRVLERGPHLPGPHHQGGQRAPADPARRVRLGYQSGPFVGPRIRRAQAQCPPATAERAWAAQVRLCGRFRRLAARKNVKSVVRRGSGAGGVPLGGDDRLMALAVNQPRFLVGRK
jgi:hypothetical protein